ncbi:Os02g0438700, partial [Oryza sativa Japonica Group]
VLVGEEAAGSSPLHAAGGRRGGGGGWGVVAVCRLVVPAPALPSPPRSADGCRNKNSAIIKGGSA